MRAKDISFRSNARRGHRARAVTAILLVGLLLQAVPPSTLARPSAQDPAHRKLVLIPGIDLECSLDRSIACDKDPTRPLDARERGEEAFGYIIDHFVETRGYDRSTDTHYFNYSPEWRERLTAAGREGHYYASETRQSVVASARILAQQMAYWREKDVPGTTYDIVAHSLGGTVAAVWASTESAESDSDSLGLVHSITTLDSPLRGGYPGFAAGTELMDPTVLFLRRKALDVVDLVSLGNTSDQFVTTDMSVFTADDGFLCPNVVSSCAYLAVDPVREDPFSHGNVLYSQATVERLEAVFGWDGPLWRQRQAPGQVQADLGPVAFVRPDPQGHQQIFVRDAGAPDVRQITSGASRKASPSWSRDAKTIVYSVGELNRSIFAVSATGGPPLQLTRPPASKSDHTPTWSPTRDEIAFISDRDGDDAVYLMSPDGSNIRLIASPTLVGTRNGLPARSHAIHQGALRWSPDGEKLAFYSFIEGWGVYTMSRDGTGLKRVAEGLPVQGVESGGIDWSPDGERLVFALLPLSSIDAAENSAIFIANADGSRVLQLTCGCTQPNGDWGDSSPMWTPDGARILFERARGVPEMWYGDTPRGQVPHVLLTMTIDGSNVADFETGAQPSLPQHNAPSPATAGNSDCPLAAVLPVGISITGGGPWVREDGTPPRDTIDVDAVPLRGDGQDLIVACNRSGGYLIQSPSLWGSAAVGWDSRAARQWLTERGVSREVPVEFRARCRSDPERFVTEDEPERSCFVV